MILEDFLVKKEVLIAVSGCAFAEDFASLYNKEAPPGNKRGNIAYIRESRVYKDAEIFNNGGAQGYKGKDIFNKSDSIFNKQNRIHQKKALKQRWN